MRLRVRVLAWCCAWGLALSASEASQVRSVDLEQLTQRAARIFSGRCITSRVVFDPNIGSDVTVATFRVDRSVKGVTGRTVTVRMSGVSKVPIFRAGEDVVLFLYGESALGLSAPVGLGQGRFAVVTDKQGRKRAINEFGNENLTRGARRKRGPAEILDPSSLLDRVERMVKEP